jgi:phosphate transport system protein
MTPLNNELKSLQEEIGKMWDLVMLQIQKAKISLVANDKDLAREVVLGEKRVNSYELAIDRECENVFALFCPVAVDLRFVLAILKINNNLERIGDYAEGIAQYVIHAPSPFDLHLLEVSRLIHMYDESAQMLHVAHKAFLNEDTTMARSLFKRDEMLDEINVSSTRSIAEYISQHPQNAEQALYVLSIIRKLERVGDQIKNIAEEIIFFIEAKVVKHNGEDNEGTNPLANV